MVKAFGKAMTEPEVHNSDTESTKNGWQNLTRGALRMSNQCSAEIIQPSVSPVSFPRRSMKQGSRFYLVTSQLKVDDAKNTQR